jgi:hypothetical protein
VRRRGHARPPRMSAPAGSSFDRFGILRQVWDEGVVAPDPARRPAWKSSKLQRLAPKPQILPAPKESCARPRHRQPPSGAAIQTDTRRLASPRPPGRQNLARRHARTFPRPIRPLSPRLAQRDRRPTAARSKGARNGFAIRSGAPGARPHGGGLARAIGASEARIGPLRSCRSLPRAEKHTPRRSKEGMGREWGVIA